jgi:glycosyltransferase involved in cell wall biosynthesis
VTPTDAVHGRIEPARPPLGATSPEVSVIIPTHNRSDLLELAARSVLAQDGASLEVIIVDDGSTDNTPAVVSSFDDPRVRVVRHERPEGQSRSRNDGIRVARGRWIAFLDDDDLWAPDKLSAQLAAAGSTRAAWVYVGSVNVTLGNRVVGGAPPPPPDDVVVRLRSSNVVPGGCSGVLATAEAVRSAGGFDPDLGPLSDWDLWLRLAERGAPAWVSRPLVAYRVHARNLSLDAGRVLREFEVVSRRAGGASRAILYRYLGWWMLRAGKRVDAVRFLVRGVLLRSQDYRLRAFLADAVYVARSFADPLLSRLGLRRQAPPSPSDPLERAWREDAQGWVDALVIGASPDRARD